MDKLKTILLAGIPLLAALIAWLIIRSVSDATLALIDSVIQTCILDACLIWATWRVIQFAIATARNE